MKSGTIKRRFTRVFFSPSRKAILLDCSGSMEPLWKMVWTTIFHVVTRLRNPIAFLGFYRYSDNPCNIEPYILDTYNNAVVFDAGKYLLAKYGGKVILKEEFEETPIIFTGGTPLWDAIDYVLKMPELADHDIIVFTDGYENSSKVTWLPENERVYCVVLENKAWSSDEKRKKARLMSVYAHIVVKKPRRIQGITKKRSINRYFNNHTYIKLSIFRINVLYRMYFPPIFPHIETHEKLKYIYR